MTDNIMQSPKFWEVLEQMVSESEIIIEAHHRKLDEYDSESLYSYRHGFLKGDTASGGKEIEVWMGSLKERSVNGLILTLENMKREAHIRLLLSCTPAECLKIHTFLTKKSTQSLLIARKGAQSWLRSRRSVRRFQNHPIPQEILLQLIETATWAPSAHNRQPWRFVILTSSASRLTLVDRMGESFREDLLSDGLSPAEADSKVSQSKSQILSAPAVVLLCLDAESGDQYPDQPRQQAEYLTGVQSVALSGGTLLLAAHAAGLAGVWMCAPLFASKIAQISLNLPDHWHPQALILLGYPKNQPKPPPRLTMDEVVLFL